MRYSHRMQRKLSNSIVRAVVAALCALIGGLIAGRSTSWVKPIQGPNQAVVIVDYVTDGDTLTVNYLGTRERLRLIGIDSPESFDDEKAHRDSARTGEKLSSILKKGDRSKAYLATVVQRGEKLRVDFDIDKRDRYDRLLGYVYLPSGELLNVKIVRDGYAKPSTNEGNHRYKREINRAYTEAKNDRRGLWGRKN